jgi:hypothetical protein
MPRPRRALGARFKSDLMSGVLKRLRELVIADRDLLLEIRAGYIDIYFKGNGLIKIKQRAEGVSEYRVSTHEKFAQGLKNKTLSNDDDVKSLIEQLPGVKHQISVHKPYASEIEIEHFLIRMNNREQSVNSEYFAVDRQGVYGPNNDRIDVLAVCWPRADRRTKSNLALCVMEVKLAMGAVIGEVGGQLKKYQSMLERDLPAVAADAQALLRDKIELGLLGTDRRLQTLSTLEISTRMDDVRFVLVLAEQNPFSKSLDPSTLGELPNVEIFRVGFGLWSSDAYRLEAGVWRRPAFFGQAT